MRNKRLIIALTFAVIFGLLATVSVARYLANAQSYQRSLGNVVVTNSSIPLGSRITAEQVTLAQMPNGSTAEGAFTTIEQVAGRIAITNIGVREPVTSFKLAPMGAAGGLSAVIPEGFRAMTVRVDDVVGISGFVMPGSFVDVVAVIVPPTDQGTAAQGPISKIVLQNIKVLANGANLDEPKDGREPSRVQAVTLQVTPEQAEKLVLATNESRLQLVMRNYGDQADTTTNGASKRTLLTGDPVVLTPGPKNSDDPKPAPAPVSRPRVRFVPQPAARVVVPQEAPKARPEPKRRAVEVIEGSKKRSVEFP